jgi:hypothetical protein
MGSTCSRRPPSRAPIIRFVWAAALVLALSPTGALAQIKINEILANPVGIDNGFERLEIYNAGPTAINVTGWCIHDAATIDGNPAPSRCLLPEDFVAAGCPTTALIQPGEFRVVQPTITNTGIFNNTTETIYLCSDRTIPATVVDQVSYDGTGIPEGQVWAALPNGSANFAWRSATLCATNGSVGDVTPPATINDLAAAAGAFPGEISLTWTAPGDDGTTGTATGYDIKLSHDPITAGNFGAAAPLERWIDPPAPLVAGTPETLIVFGLNPDSTWYFAIQTHDDVPNLSGVSNSPSSLPHAGFLVNPDLGYTAYFGNLHSHTSYSDGVQTPAAAYAYARNTARTPLDFLAVTEHNHVSAGMSLAHYTDLENECAAANDDGNFVAIFGQEWGLAANGHVNVFESPALFGWDAGQYDVFVDQTDYAGLYSAVLANPPASYPPIAELCHPASGDFNSLVVTNDGKSVVHLMALVNGPSQSTATDESDIGNTNFDGQFAEALRKGYRVSPTGDQDNHNATWGASTESRTAVLAHAKTKSEILNAMAARRTYATQDHNVVVDFSAEGHTMGEAFIAGRGIRIAASVTDPDPADAVAQIELYRGITGVSNAAVIAHSTGSNTFQWRELQSFGADTEAHYYLRIRMADNQSIWTGPVYVTYDPSAPLAVGDPPAGALRLAAHPNPTSGQINLEITLPTREPRATVAIYDLSGRLVRSLANGALAAGEHRLTWDGRGADGARAHAGVFFLRLDTTRGSVSKKVLVLD